MIRTMRNMFRNIPFYVSSFDTDTGVLVRQVEMLPPPDPNADPYVSYSDAEQFCDLFMNEKSKLNYESRQKFRHDWDEHVGYSRRDAAFSPSPETIDIQITNKCGFGCAQCYQNSTPENQHGPADLVERVIKAFDHAPYQVALGGGETTGHPEFVSILKSARDLNTVPNYTTAGHLFKPDVADATNKYCGGIAISYHPHKGIEWFTNTYRKWREALKVQINIHVIADNRVVESLTEIANLQGQAGIGPISVVLLAYYGDVGRATLTGLMKNHTYMIDLPNAIRSARAKGVQIAFSEGLLPYFLSRPAMGVDTRYAMASEGNFSAYVDMRGVMSKSSFHPPPEDYDKDHIGSLKYGNLQKRWSKPAGFGGGNKGDVCMRCPETNRCAAPDVHHFLICAHAKHNKIHSLKQVGGAA